MPPARIRGTRQVADIEAVRPLDGDTKAVELFRKELAGHFTECTNNCGWFFKVKCPKCLPSSIDIHV